MGVILVSDIGLPRIEESLKGVRWFYYSAGILGVAGNGDDDFATQLIPRSGSFSELKNKIIETLQLSKTELSSYNYKNLALVSVFIHDTPGESCLLIRIGSINYGQSITEETIQAMQEIDLQLDKMEVQFVNMEYMVQPIFGPEFKGKNSVRIDARSPWPTPDKWLTQPQWRALQEESKKNKPVVVTTGPKLVLANAISYVFLRGLLPCISLVGSVLKSFKNDKNTKS